MADSLVKHDYSQLFIIHYSLTILYPPIQQMNDPFTIAGIFFRMGYLYDSHSIIIQYLEQFHYLFALL